MTRHFSHRLVGIGSDEEKGSANANFARFFEVKTRAVRSVYMQYLPKEGCE